MHLKITDIFYGQHNNVKHPDPLRKTICNETRLPIIFSPMR